MVHCDGVLPIRKIDSATVALSSYYGKVFVMRNEKKVNDFTEWLARQLFVLGFSETPTNITGLNPADVFDNLFKAPKIYTALSKNFNSFKVGEYTLMFNNRSRYTLLGYGTKDSVSDKAVADIEGTTYRLVGTDAKGLPILVDYKDNFFRYVAGTPQPLGSFFDISLIDLTSAPVDFATLKVFSKSISVGVALGYLIGLDNLLTLLKVTPRIYEAGKRVALSVDEYVLAFKDKKYVFSRRDTLASLVLAGFNEYHKEIKQYDTSAFNNKDVYLNLLDSIGIGARYLKEIDLLDDMFVDTITKGLLVDMHEPTTFRGLLVRGSELLVNDYHPDTQDLSYQRFKGYERISGAIYRELVISTRNFRARNIRGKSAIELNPYAVWKTITGDSANMLVADINPIENLKQAEAVTYTGEGGRNKDAITKSSRIYHKNDMGTISEATVDSSDVAVNTFLSANPLLNSVRGTVDKFDMSVDGASSLLSTSALVSIGAQHDD